MKIELLVQGFRTFAPEASNITLQILAEELVKEGHEVVIFGNQILKQPLTEKICGYRVIRQKSEYYGSKIKGILQLLNYSKLIKREIKESGKEFDVIHNFGASPLLAIRGIRAKMQSKHAKLIQTIKANTKYGFSYLFSPLLNLFDVVTVPNNMLKRKLMKFGLSEKKITVVPSYIDTNKFKPMDKNKLKSKYGLKNKKILIYYGHMSEFKGISYLIDAIELIKDEEFTVLFVTGSGENYIAPYEKIIKDKKLGNKIKIIKTPVKKTKNIEEYVAMADFVVLPYPDLTSTEAQPSCILESMASKTLVITSDLPELREFLTNKEVIFAKPRNAEDLAGKIKSVLNGKIKKTMIEIAYRKAKQFDYRKVIEKYIEVYKK
ncbi:glycosyltransferase family 4 protein [Candidatus Woesearchaeota archaeon]|nr:glycosyltransferase family 4 protein [Candidatus Woesearchaeota archaeon]